MNRQELVERQTPLKEKYRDAHDAALVTLKAEGQLRNGVSCSGQT